MKNVKILLKIPPSPLSAPPLRPGSEFPCDARGSLCLALYQPYMEILNKIDGGILKKITFFCTGSLSWDLF